MGTAQHLRAARPAQVLCGELPAFYSLTRPADDRARPVLVEVPHAGLAVPDVVRHELRGKLDGLARDSDIYVDKLFADAPDRGASFLVAHTSRYVVDLNRSADDVDPAAVPNHPRARAAGSRGVVWRVATDGSPILKRPLDSEQLRARIQHFYSPYHEALANELATLHERHGFSILVAAHSMPSVGRGLRSPKISRRADVVPGTRDGHSADPRLVELVAEHFRSAGLSVRMNDPYRGGYSTGAYGRPEQGVHAIQIELNRGIYVDETTSEPRAGDFEKLQALLADLITAVGQLDLR